MPDFANPATDPGTRAAMLKQWAGLRWSFLEVRAQRLRLAIGDKVFAAVAALEPRHVQSLLARAWAQDLQGLAGDEIQDSAWLPRALYGRGSRERWQDWRRRRQDFERASGERWNGRQRAQNRQK